MLTKVYMVEGVTRPYATAGAAKGQASARQPKRYVEGVKDGRWFGHREYGPKPKVYVATVEWELLDD